MMRRRIGVLLVIAMLCMTMAVSASGLSGMVSGARWNNAATTALIRSTQGSLNSITRAYVSVIINPAQTLVTLGFVVQVQAPTVEADSPVGVILLLGGHEIGRWQHGDDAVYEDENYSLRGAAWIPADTPASLYNMVIELGCKHAAAFENLQHLRLQLIDPQGRPSLEHDFPIVVEPLGQETLPPPPPQAPPATIANSVRTIPTTTTAAPLTFALPRIPTQAPAPTQATTQHVPTTEALQFVTATAWHTVIIEQTAEPAPAADLPVPTQFTFAFDSLGGALTLPPAEHAQVDSPAPHVQDHTANTPAAQNNTWLYVAGVGLLLMAIGLVGYWAKTRKEATAK